jgi:hydroxymethylglutaryl-CoA lyase
LLARPGAGPALLDTHGKICAHVLDKLPPKVIVYEVGPRDGLQNEARLIGTDDKVAFIDALSETGLGAIEITSFVNPKWIPQLADAVEVSRRITRRPGVAYSALVPNRQGLEGALKAGMKEIAVFMSASETHNKKNVNKSIAATLEAFRDTVPPALAAGLKVRAYVSTVYGCPYEGAVDPQKAVDLCRELRALGCYQVSLGDTIGVANPRQVRDVLARVLAEVPLPEVAVHFHDTRGTALANILVSVEMGITTVDAALGGLGGCPYAPGASGNVATEDVVYMLEGMGVRTGVDLDKLVQVSRFASTLVGHEVPSKYYRAAIGTRSRATTTSSTHTTTG